MRIHALAVLSVLAATGTARAEDFVLPDGTRWSVDGTTLRRGAISASLRIHNVGIDCAAGFGNKPRAAAAYLPPGYIATEQPDDGGTHADACIDGNGNGVLVFSLKWRGSLAPADHDAIRGLLAGFALELAQVPAEAQTLALFQPAIAKVPLTVNTGVWDFVAGATNSNDAILLQTWPLEVAGLKVQRNPKPQRCSTVGFPGSRPSWAPSSFAPLGMARDGNEMACLDQRDGTLLIVSTQASMSAGVRSRTRALLDEMAKVLGSAAPATAPSTGAEPSGSVFVSSSSYTPPPSPSTAPASSTSGSNPPPAAYAYNTDRPSRSLTSYLRGFSLGVHRLSAAMDTIEDGYGGSIGYAGSGRKRGFHPLYAVSIGYDRKSKLVADAQLALGTRGGDSDFGAGLYAAAGFDGVGLGEDAAPDRVFIPGEIYYGGLATLRLGSLDLGLGYFGRNSDEVGSEWRFELGYRLESGRRIVGRYLSYADTGSFLSLALAL